MGYTDTRIEEEFARRDGAPAQDGPAAPAAIDVRIAELETWCLELTGIAITHPSLTQRQDATVALAMATFPQTEPLGYGQCCRFAKLVPCRCRASWECPIHGNLCIGSHD